MNRNRNNQSRNNSGGNRGYGGSGYNSNNDFSNFGGPSLMDSRSGMRDFSEDFDFDSNRGRGYNDSSNKTPEMVAFDTEFKKWEDSFSDWKIANKNHPDREQYRFYEQKFLDVRKKLMEKRMQIYGNSSRSRSNEPVFENQLFAADAMAESILSKFGADDGPRRSRGNNRSNSGGRNDNFGGGYGGMGGGRNDFNGPQNYYGPGPGMGGGMRMGGGPGMNMGGGMGMGGLDGQLVGELARLGSNPSNRWIFNALSRALSNPEPPRPLMRGMRNMVNRKRDNIPRKSDSAREGVRSKTSGAAKRMKRNVKTGKSHAERMPNDREHDPVKAAELFYARLDQMFEDARNAECPKFLPGSATKRIKAVRAKKPEDLEEREKKLLELMEYVHAKRKAFFEKRDKDKEEAKLLEGDGTEGEAKEAVKSDEDQIMADAPAETEPQPVAAPTA